MSSPEAKADKLMKSALKNIKYEDILHRGFLKPIEVALKTYKTEPKDSQFKPGALPKGLKIAVRGSLTSDKRTFHNVSLIQKNTTYQEIKENNQDNVLSLMKHLKGIKLAICVCMYSQDKKMLKNTLSGVADNIANMVAYEKLDPDQVGIFVMMDGIEKVDRSIIDYFEELQRSSNINLGDNIVPSLTMEEIALRAMKMSEDEIDELQIKNVNNYLFDVAQLQERNNLRFAQVRKDYDQVKDLLKQIKKLKEGKPLFDDLPAKLKPFFYQQAKQQRKRQYALTDDDIKQEQRDEISKDRLQKKLHEDYALNILKARPLVMKALQEGERFCNNYISTREDLAYVACFRKKIPFSAKVIQRSRGGVVTRANLYQDQAQTEQPNTTMNLFMCVKYKNAGKLSSHNWFFNGFCQQLRPQFAILLDVGLRPSQQALMKMYRYLKSNVRQEGRLKGGVGGVCGYMSLKIQKVEGEEQVKDEDIDFLTGIINKFTDIQRTQQVQYHFAHLMDKGFQAAFGFIHVLPGALSAYNMKAIIDYEKDQDDELLKNYFKSIDEKLANRKVIRSQMSVGNVLLRTCLPDFLNSCFIDIDPESDQAMLYSENVYLAEDRILCMGIHKKGYDMSFLPDAYAEVDPIKTVHGLLGQRKRWINGSYFAFQKVKKELRDHQKNIGCEIFLNLQIFYLSMMNGLSYFAPAFFLFTVHIAMDAFRSDVLVKLLNGVVGDPNNSQVYNAFVYTMDFIYVMLIMTIVFLSLHLTNRHKRFLPYIYGVSTLFGLFMVCVFLVLIVDIFRGLLHNDSFLILNQNLIQQIPGGITTINIMRWLLIGSVGIYIVPITVYIIFFGREHILCEIIFGGFSFLFYGPTYLNILNIYSLCRIDDISWGTKGLDSGSEKNSSLKDSWKLIKFIHVVKYVAWNVILGAVLLTLGASYTPRFFITITMVVLIGVSMSIKVFLSCIYMVGYWFYYRSRAEQPTISMKSRIDTMLEDYKQSILDEVRQNLEGVKKEYLKNPRRNGSFIQAARKGENAKDAFKKQQNLQKGRSGVQGKSPFKKGKQKEQKQQKEIKGLSIIEQEADPQPKKIIKKSEEKKGERKIEVKLEDSGDMMVNSDSGIGTDQKLMKKPDQIMPAASDRPLQQQKKQQQQFKRAEKPKFQKNKFKKQKK